jgi:hypothetical protein
MIDPAQGAIHGQPKKHKRTKELNCWPCICASAGPEVTSFSLFFVLASQRYAPVPSWPNKKEIEKE